MKKCSRGPQRLGRAEKIKKTAEAPAPNLSLQVLMLIILFSLSSSHVKCSEVL